MNSTIQDEIEVLVDLKPSNNPMCHQNSVIRVSQHLSPSQFAAKIVSSFDVALTSALPNGYGFISISKCLSEFDGLGAVQCTDQDFLEDGDKFEVDFRSAEADSKDSLFLFPVNAKVEVGCNQKLTEHLEVSVKNTGGTLQVPLQKPEKFPCSYENHVLPIDENSKSFKQVFTPVQSSGLYEPAVKHQQQEQQQLKASRFDLSSMGSVKRRYEDGRQSQSNKRFISSQPNRHPLDRVVHKPSASSFSKSDRTSTKTCHNCGGRGHIAIQCPSELGTCFNCKQKGHFSRECPRPVKCHKCHAAGHFAIQCPEVEKCYNCNEQGHIRANCSLQEKKCFNCRGADHLSRDCPYPVMCNACGATDHVSKSCPSRLV